MSNKLTLDEYLALPYTRMLKRDEDGAVLASVMELNGCLTEGATDAEALANLGDAMRTWLEMAIEAGCSIPVPAAEVEPGDVRQVVDPETLAQRFHELYEELAPSHGYETRVESRKPWGDVPAQNKALMTAVCARIMSEFAAQPPEVELAAELSRLRDDRDLEKRWRKDSDDLATTERERAEKAEADVERLRTLLRQAAVATGEQLGEWEELPKVIARQRAEVEQFRQFVQDFIDGFRQGARAGEWYIGEAKRLLAASSSAPSGWQPIEQQHPPRHRRLAFRTKDGQVFAGAACYGMHAPWWCANRSDGGTDVLNDRHEVTHWMLLEDDPS